jgi:ADP-heptose:LPS heptosyltransferase
MAIDLDLISIDDRFIPQLNIINFKNKIGIHFGASMKIRRPSISKIIEFLNVFNHLYNENHILIFKTLEDTNTSDFIYNYLKSLCKNVEYWEGCLGDFIIKLSECKELFCLDSGPGHIAAALQVKVHVIFGPSHPNYSRPIGENVIIYGTINKPKCWPCDGKKCINEVFQKCYSNNLLN